jgi:hypothetical protein
MKCATEIYEEFASNLVETLEYYNALSEELNRFILWCCKLKVISSSKCKWRANLGSFLRFAAEPQILGSLLIAFYRLVYTEWSIPSSKQLSLVHTLLC